MRSLILFLIALLGLSTIQPTKAAAQPPAHAAPASRIVLPPPKAGRARPLIAIVADEAGAETTDFLVPYGVLGESGVAEVVALSTAAGPLQLMATVRIQPDATLARFDAAQPAGADIVIVPAQHRPRSKILAAWIRRQADKGAVIMSICEGARVLAGAGLLDGRRATTHFAALKDLEARYPQTTWVRDRRWVQDGPVISTTGVAASLPASLALVEAIAGPQAARRTAARLDVTDWSMRHRTSEFGITSADYALGVSNLARFWTHDLVEVPAVDGVDEVALALMTDAWQRGMRSKVVVAGARPVRSRHGLVILPDAAHRNGALVLRRPAGGSGKVLDWVLAEMTRRYGPPTARLAWLGLEYGREDGRL